MKKKKNKVRKKNKILIIDDQPEIVEPLSEMCESNGFEVFLSTSVDDSYKVLEKNKDVRLIFQDCNMGGIDDRELLKQLKRRSPSSEVIINTGGSAKYSHGDFQKAGAKDVVNKRTSLETLEGLIYGIFGEIEESDDESDIDENTDIKEGNLDTTGMPCCDEVDSKLNSYILLRKQKLKALLEKHPYVVVVDPDLEARITADLGGLTFGDIEPSLYNDSLKNIIDNTTNILSRKKAPEEKRFHEVVSGRFCKTYRDLAYVLMFMDDETYLKYVTQYKNEFSNWVGTAVGDKKTADKIHLTKSKYKIIDLLLDIPLVFIMDDNEKDILNLKKDFDYDVIPTKNSIDPQKKGELDHYSLFVLSEKHYSRLRVTSIANENNLSMKEELVSLNKKFYVATTSQLWIEMLAFLHTVDRFNVNGDIKFPVLTALVSYGAHQQGEEGILLDHGKYRFNILESIVGNDTSNSYVIKVTDTQFARLKNEVKAVKYYNEKGFNFAENLGCVTLDGNFTISVFKKIKGKRADKIIDDLNKNPGLKYSKHKSEILDKILDTIVDLQFTDPPEESIVDKTHKDPKTQKNRNKNKTKYIREIALKFIGSPKEKDPTALPRLIKDEGYIKSLRDKVLGSSGAKSFNLSESVYAPIADIVASAKPGIYTDRSLYNCFFGKESDLIMVDLETLRNSPNTFDVATAFEMKDLISNKKTIKLKKSLYIKNNLAYKKKTKISEKEKLLYDYVTKFNNKAEKEGKPDMMILDYFSFLKEYYAVGVQRALVHFGTFTRLMKNEVKEEEGLNRKYAVQCLENAIHSTDMLKNRFSEGKEFNQLYAMLKGVRKRL